MYTHKHTHTHTQAYVCVQSCIFTLIYMLLLLEGRTGEDCETSTKQCSSRNREHCIEKNFHLKSGDPLGYESLKKLKKNSVALVRDRTIPTERPPPVGEVSANFWLIEGCHVISAKVPHGR